MAIESEQPKRDTITVGAQFDKTTHAQIKAVARTEERSVANLVRLALKQYISTHKFLKDG